MADNDYPHLEGFKFEDYAKRAQGEEGLDSEIKDADDRQEERDSTPAQDVNWEKRYKDLEQHNSRQAQDLGHLKKEVERYQEAFDKYLAGEDPTPDNGDAEAQKPISTDDILDRPDEAINRAIDNHPEIRKAREAAQQAERDALAAAQNQFAEKHPNYQETLTDPAFAEWVRSDRTRVALAQQADQYDFGAADALFSLYEAEQQLNGMQAEAQNRRELEEATLESAGVGDPPADPKYSRTEMREQMIAAKQGDPKAARYLETHLPKYRAALAAGEVTD